MDTVNSPSQVGHEIDVLNGGAQEMAKTNGHRVRETPETV
jgi:hypothetical protein